MRESENIFTFLRKELRPRGNIFTPFNIISGITILAGAILIAIRFIFGLSYVTNLNQEFPWGLWVAFDVMAGVAFSGGAYVLCFVVYILNEEKYHPIIRATILNGLLGYMFYAGALVFDLGRWWNAMNAFIGREFGVNSVLFLVAWHFFLYTICLLIEYSQVLCEWLGLKRVRLFVKSITLGTVIFGIWLSTLHQAGIGALVLMAKPNIHPLWFSEFVPVLFFVSSLFAGLSMVIFEGSISKRVFWGRLPIEHEHVRSHDEILLSLGKACAVIMFGYFFIRLFDFIHGHHWVYLGTIYGMIYVIENVGFVIVPMILFSVGARERKLLYVKVASLLTMIGIIINRFNYVFVAYKWYIPFSMKYIPTWMEVVVTLSIVFLEIWAFRFCVNRMPVLTPMPAWAKKQDEKKSEEAVIPLWRKEAIL
ncbi:MAG: polysulfide reductase NrfD [Deltaproteobacteria bacterium]|nr:polysulfide reductase NrfD [Deltaproteobacteria bacterium]